MNNRNSGRGGGDAALPFIVGAAIGAASVYLSDKKNRDKLRAKWEEAKSEGKETISELSKKGSEKLETFQKKLDEEKKKADKVIDDTQMKMRT